MGIIALIIGGIIGYLLAENVTAKNWTIKLCYALVAPIAVVLILAVLIGITTGNGYLAGTYCTPVIIACIPYIAFVLASMKRKNKK